tara:strand:- start:155926 stop:156282 length:357 start_codon:yes stop_codon:yes gene_type:complete
MAKEELRIIKEADLTNNCPECFNQALRLSFYQKHIYNKLYHKISSDVTHEIKCKTCESLIYPVKWTEDIERVFDYYRKMVTPDRSSIRFTALFYILVLFCIVLVAAGSYYFLREVIQF